MVSRYRIRTRLITLLACTSFIFLIFFIVMYFWSSTRLDEITRNRLYAFQHSLEQVVARNSEPLEAVAQDYSLWDEMYELVSQYNQGWAVENIDESVPVFGVQNAWVVDLQGEIVHRFSLIKSPISIPFSAAQLKNIDAQSGLHGFYSYGSGSAWHVAEFQALPIQRSDDYNRQGAIAGWFVVAWDIDDEYIETIAEQLGAEVKLVISAEKKKNIINNWHLVSQHNLLEADGTTQAAMIEASVDMHDLRQVSNTGLLVLLLSLVYLVIFILINYLFLGKIIINPIRAMNKALDEGSSKPIKRYVAHENEIGRLSKLIVQFLKQQQSLSNDVKQKEVALIDMEFENQSLYEASRTDQLTQISNRRSFEEYFELSWHTAFRGQTILSIILVDIDYFKAYNDNYGHQKGDEALRQVAEIMTQSVRRKSDLLARYGGEEFVVVCPNTDCSGAEILAERIRQDVFNSHIEHKHSAIEARITLSLGVASMQPSADMTRDMLLSLADSCLYKAKNDGRNRVVCDRGES